MIYYKQIDNTAFNFNCFFVLFLEYIDYDELEAGKIYELSLSFIFIDYFGIYLSVVKKGLG